MCDKSIIPDIPDAFTNLNCMQPVKRILSFRIFCTDFIFRKNVTVLWGQIEVPVKPPRLTV